MHLSSIVVHAEPRLRQPLRRTLEALPGVEVHVDSGDGRFVVTIESEDATSSIRTYESIERCQGVISVALVYQHDDGLRPDEQRESKT